MSKNCHNFSLEYTLFVYIMNDYTLLVEVKTKRIHSRIYADVLPFLCHRKLGFYERFLVRITNMTPEPKSFDIRWGGSLIHQSILIPPLSSRKIYPFPEDRSHAFVICPIEEWGDGVGSSGNPAFEILDTGKDKSFKILFIHDDTKDQPMPQNFVSSKTMEL